MGLSTQVAIALAKQNTLAVREQHPLLSVHFKSCLDTAFLIAIMPPVSSGHIVTK
jgi:hypothetical protein